MYRNLLFCCLLLFLCANSYAQILTREDSLAAGLEMTGQSATVISGYGEAVYSQNFTSQTATASLRRAVLFVGHRFNQNISLFTEMEMENALVAGNEEKGEIAMEQAFLKFDLSPNTYLNVGLFTPRIGIINENHLPNTYNGNDRPIVETMIIPATWREIGVSINGTVPALPGLNYTFGIYNGLDARKFSLPEGLVEGRFEGSNATARNKAVSGSLLYYTGGFRLQGSSYVGGSVGFDNKTADRLGVNTGFFGTPVFMNEVNAQFRKNGWTFKALGVLVNIPDADKINAAFANNTPEEMRGGYGELGYDILHGHTGDRQLIAFARYEYVDMNAKIPGNGIKNEAYTQNHVFVGVNYLPIRNITLKADFHFMSTGDFNQSLIVNPDPYVQPWFNEQSLLNIGMGYSF